MLAVKDISHEFSDGKSVLNGLSFDISRGEIIAFLGPSGCGKSTLLRLISGLLPLQVGVIELEERKSFSFVFQDPSLMPWATVRKNISLPLDIKGHDSADIVENVLKATEISDLIDRYPSQISGGQKMRVSIARALVAEPDLLLLDEPFAALDELLRFKMNDLILGLRKSLGIATVFVTHSIFEATYMADRVLVMQDGKIAGSVIPGLDRTATPEDQRSSAAFIIASRQISALLGGA